MLASDDWSICFGHSVTCAFSESNGMGKCSVYHAILMLNYTPPVGSLIRDVSICARPWSRRLGFPFGQRIAWYWLVTPHNCPLRLNILLPSRRAWG